jgi:Tol biopolymer transport system component
MTVSPGLRFGPYEITTKLGQGGMGEVWRARDTKLGREVAIKFLPPALTQDTDRLARFEREARVLAALNHPNIAAIYGLEEKDGSRGLVMELVEGETLGERLARGPMSIEEALGVFRQIAEALEAAHAQGIVHRDLKPQNVKLRPDGTVKVLDFGLAKAAEPTTASGPSDPTFSPTLTTPGATAAGVILGTAAYMSPEQARGRVVDKRADIWAFGVVLYEALTGRRLFEGETVTDTLAAVLRAEIDWGLLPAETPTSLRNLLRRCLERDPRNRLHDIADARIVLDELASGRHEERARVLPRTRQRRLAPWLVAAFGLGVVAGILVSSFLAPTARPISANRAPVSFRQLTALPGGEGQVAIAADGQSFAYVKKVDGQTDIFVQRVDGRNPILVTSGCKEDDEFPAFSPDGRRIAFHSSCAGGGLFVMGATGESVRKITDFGFSPSWSPDGREIVVVTEKLLIPWGRISLSELWAVDVETGTRRRISEHDAMQPSWSPDGKRIAFWGLRPDTSTRDIWTVAADGSELAAGAAIPVTEDTDLDWNPVWAADGGSLYFASTRGGTMNLWHVALDTRTGRPRGQPQPRTTPSSWAGWISLSRDGSKLAFVDRNARTTLERAPFDAARVVLAAPPRPVPLGTTELYDQIDLSPDGSSVLFANAGLPQWLFLARADGGDVRQLSDGPYRDRQASFSPDGQWIVFQSTRWPSQFGMIRPDGSGMRGIASKETDGWFPVWSPDGKRIAASSQHGAYVLDPWVTDAERAVTAIAAPPDDLFFTPRGWTRDGRQIIGLMRDRRGPRIGRIGVYTVADRSYRIVPSTVEDVVNLSDGRRAVANSVRRIDRVDLVSGAAQEIATAPPGYDILSVVISRDEKWIAWVEMADESDIWLAELGP